jgi:putative transposase
MKKVNSLRRSRHSVVSWQVHLVLVSTPRFKVFDSRAIDLLREIFEEICADLDTQLIEINWEADHLHLMLSFPQKFLSQNS